MRRSAIPHGHGRLARVLALTLTLTLATTGLVAPRAVLAQVPGPEIFDKEPTTPLELWEAADYLVRTSQAAKAVPYLQKFLDAEPDDAALIQIRDKYGFGSALRLQDHPATERFAEPATRKIIEATRRFDTNPERVAGFVALLAKSPLEQNLAVQGLRAAGPAAVPAVLEALRDPALDDADRAKIAENLGRLGSPAVPPLLAALESPDGPLASKAADALGRIGDRRAIPWLTAAAVAGKGDAKARTAAARALETITGQPFASQPKTPGRLLTDEARRYQSHQMRFPGDPVNLWGWDADANAPAPRTVSLADAEAELGQKLADAALAVDPNDRLAQAARIGLNLGLAITRNGFEKFPGEDSRTLDEAVAAGPDVLAEVLRQAVDDGDDNLGAVVAGLLGGNLKADAVAYTRPFHPLVKALDAHGRRTRFAAAKALASVDPPQPFPGSSRVVPVLAHALEARSAPRAVVIDGNLSRGNNLAGHLRALGYDATATATGDEGFREAAASADVELILLDQQMLMSDWKLQDTLANLQADARTAGIPVYVFGPLAMEYNLPTLLERFPRVKRIVTPANPEILDTQLKIVGKPSPLSAAEKAARAREAATLLSRIATQPRSPYASDLLKVEPSVMRVIRDASTGAAAMATLAETPALEAQRGLADALTDPATPTALRSEAGARLTRSIRKFGPLLTGVQEVRLVDTYNQEANPSPRSTLAAVLDALRRRDPAEERPANAPAVSTPNALSPAAEAPAPAPRPLPESE